MSVDIGARRSHTGRWLAGVGVLAVAGVAVAVGTSTGGVEKLAAMALPDAKVAAAAGAAAENPDAGDPADRPEPTTDPGDSLDDAALEAQSGDDGGASLGAAPAPAPPPPPAQSAPAPSPASEPPPAEAAPEPPPADAPPAEPAPAEEPPPPPPPPEPALPPPAQDAQSAFDDFFSAVEQGDPDAINDAGQRLGDAFRGGFGPGGPFGDD